MLILLSNIFLLISILFLFVFTNALTFPLERATMLKYYFTSKTRYGGQKT